MCKLAKCDAAGLMQLILINIAYTKSVTCFSAQVQSDKVIDTGEFAEKIYLKRCIPPTVFIFRFSFLEESPDHWKLTV